VYAKRDAQAAFQAAGMPAAAVAAGA
jgi:hypothetical protein